MIKLILNISEDNQALILSTKWAVAENKMFKLLHQFLHILPKIYCPRDRFMN